MPGADLPGHPSWRLVAALVVAAAVSSCSRGDPSPPPCVSDGIHGYTLLPAYHGSNGVITIDPSWSPECIEALHVDVDGAYVGTVRRGVPLRWDSRTVPDGVHVFGYQPDGWPRWTDHRWVDNTPPTPIVCEPTVSRWGELTRFGGIHVVYDEPCCQWDMSSRPYGTCTYQWQDTWHYPFAANSSLPRQVWVPSYPNPWLVADMYRNPVPLGLCGAYYDAWLTPWGDGPIAGIESRALGGFGRSHVVHYDDPFAELLFLDRDTGALRLEGAVPPDPWSALPISGLDPARTVIELAGRSWIARTADGTLELRARVADTSPPRDAYVTTLDPAREPRLQPPGGFAVAWTELGDDGRRIGRVAYDWFGEGAWEFSPALVPTPGMDVVEVHPVYWGGVAVVEASPGGPGQVRFFGVRFDPFTWIDLGGVLNRDPSRSASQARAEALGDMLILAWVEDGQVLTRLNFLGVGDGFKPAAVMNADPSSPARAPRMIRSAILTFVEQGPTGDRIEVRERREATTDWYTWASIEAGEVADYVTSYQLSLVVAWADAEGRVRLRAFNE